MYVKLVFALHGHIIHLEHIVEGQSSDAENFRDQFSQVDDRTLITDSLQGLIDTSRFAVTSSASTAVTGICIHLTRFLYHLCCF